MRVRALRDRFDRSTWLVAPLLLAILVATGCVLWFMNQAITSQTAAAQHSLVEAYRGQLRLVRDRVDAHWRAHASSLNRGGTPASLFVQLLDAGVDGALLLDTHGTPAFPRRDDARRLVAAEVERLGGGAALPFDAALTLSLQMVEAGAAALDMPGFQPTPVADVWAFASQDGRVIALYRTATVQAMMHDLLHEAGGEKILYVALPPGVSGDHEAIAAGASLPGWQLSFLEPIDATAVDDAARRRVTVTVWVGVAGVAVMAILGVAAAQALRRQLRLASLKTDLVAAVSHELRTPLTSMRVLVDGLLADERQDPVKTREYLELIAGEQARLTRLIENFLTFSRLERHRHQFAFTPTDPASVVAAALDAVRGRVPPSSQLRVDVEAGLPPIMADADALGTALVNLLDNAIKYTPGDKRIAVRAYGDRGSVVFAVQDNGIGIPVREQRRIFRRFYRIDQRLSRETSGVGLGLSIVEQVVKAHGGSIRVTSEAGGGSTFALHLPSVGDGLPA